MSFLDEDPIPLDDEDEASPIEPEPEGDDDRPNKPKITMFGESGGGYQESSTRQPNATGTGATRCRTFYAKLRPEGLTHLDATINQWLNDNPDYEVKFATVCVGELKGKITEQAMFLSVFV